MRNDYKQIRTSRDKNGGEFRTYSNGTNKITEYTSKNNKVAIFESGKKVNKKRGY